MWLNRTSLHSRKWPSVTAAGPEPNDFCLYVYSIYMLWPSCLLSTAFTRPFYCNLHYTELVKSKGWDYSRGKVPNTAYKLGAQAYRAFEARAQEIPLNIAPRRWRWSRLDQWAWKNISIQFSKDLSKMGKCSYKLNKRYNVVRWINWTRFKM